MLVLECTFYSPFSTKASISTAVQPVCEGHNIKFADSPSLSTVVGCGGRGERGEGRGKEGEGETGEGVGNPRDRNCGNVCSTVSFASN